MDIWSIRMLKTVGVLTALSWPLMPSDRALRSAPPLSKLWQLTPAIFLSLERVELINSFSPSLTFFSFKSMCRGSGWIGSFTGLTATRLGANSFAPEADIVYVLTGFSPEVRFNLFSLQKKVIHGRFMYYERILIDIHLKEDVRFIAYMTNS